MRQEIERPAPAPAAEPAAEPDEDPTPEAQPSTVELCLSTGQVMTVEQTPDGRLVVEPGAMPVDAAFPPADRFPGAYAADEPWFVDDEPVRFEERDHLRSGGEFRADCDRLVRVGEVGEVPLFVTLGMEEPYEALHVPVRPGIWQLYRADLARVRG